MLTQVQRENALSIALAAQPSPSDAPRTVDDVIADAEKIGNWMAGNAQSGEAGGPAREQFTDGVETIACRPVGRIDRHPTVRRYAVVDAANRIVYRAAFQNDLRIRGAANGLSWNGGKPPFKVYGAEEFGDYGYIGDTPRFGFTDDNITPDLGRCCPGDAVAVLD